MAQLSDHTLQINLWIALTSGDPTFSRTLDSLDYDCVIMEQPLFSGDTKVRPDVIVSSPNLNHAVLVDCKSNTIDQDQLERYGEMANREEVLIQQAGVTDVAVEDLFSEAALSSFTDLSEREEVSGAFAVVYFERSPGNSVTIWNPDENEFKLDELADAFPLNQEPKSRIPTRYYPFSDLEEDRRALVSKVLQSVISLATKQGEFSVEEVMKDAHPFWGTLSNDQREHLLRRGALAVEELYDAGMQEHIEAIAGSDKREWKSVSPSIRAIQDSTEYYINRVTDALDQQTLGDYDTDG